jgi:hypothetical protein
MIMPLIPYGNYVQWSLTGQAPAGSYRFQLERSGGPAGPWELVADQVDVWSWYDRFGDSDDNVAPNALSLVREFYYRLLVRAPDGTSTSVISEVNPTLAPKQRQLLRKLLHDEYVVLRKASGVPVAVVKRRQWGTRCPLCFDQATQENVRPDCTNCWGTGLVGGYWTPVLTYARRAPLQSSAQIAPEQRVEIATTRIVMLNLPHVERDDMIVFLSDNRRFWVDQQSETSLRTVPVHQTVFASELPHSHIFYRVPVDPRSQPPML